MATQTIAMTSSEFAKAAGVSAASISKLIRDGKLKAKKEGGKWMIPQSQLGSEAVRALKGSAKKGKPKPAVGRQAVEAAAASTRPTPISPAPVAPTPAESDYSAPASPVLSQPKVQSTEKTFSITEFAAMSYLTEKGVAEWLRSGRIKGIQKENGEWEVLERNLQVADISRLLRK
jgi:phage antirepressor YoqD-like protein